MVGLVLKDIFIQKKSFVTGIFFAVLMVFAFKSAGIGAYMMGAMGVVFLLIAGAFMYDEKSRGDILINSLPVSRKEVVAARYLSLIVFSLIAVALVSLAGIIIRAASIPAAPDAIGLPDILGILLMLFITFSVYIPIYFKFGYVKSRVVNIILYVALFGVSGLVYGIQKAVIENPGDAFTLKLLSLLNSIPSWMIGPLLLLLTLTILLISMGLSARFYAKREF